MEHPPPPSNTVAAADDHMSIPPLTFTYKAYRLATSSPSFPFLAGKYSALSNLALTSDPDSFGVHYSTEGAFSFQDYQMRLSRPTMTVFVVVAHPSDLPEEEMSIERGAWIGMVTQIGPTLKSEYWLPKSGCDEPLSNEKETRFHHTATWIDSAHRKRGLSKFVINAAVDWAVKESFETASVEQVRFRAIMGPTNNLSMGLYGGLGWKITGKSTISEAMNANGNEGIPFHGRNDWPEAMMHDRGGVVMERVIRR